MGYERFASVNRVDNHGPSSGVLSGPILGFSSPRAAGSNDSTSDGRRGRVGRGMHTAIVVVIGFALLGLCLALA